LGSKTLYWIAAIAVVGVLTFAVLSKLGYINQEEKTKVSIESATLRNLTESVTASGKIFPVKEVKVSSDVSGEVVRLQIQEGDTVYKGQLLAMINSKTYKSVVRRAKAQLNQTQAGVSNSKALQRQAKAQLDQAYRVYQRNKVLYDEQVISASEFDQARSAVATARAAYEASRETIKGNEYGVESAAANVVEAQEQLRQTQVYAPITGVVTSLFVKSGERVVGTAQMAGTEMMRIASLDKLKVEVEVGENDIPKVKKNDEVDIEVEAYRNKIFKGIVSQISSQKQNGLGSVSVNDQVTNYTVQIEILAESYRELASENPGRMVFRPGMSASVEIFTKQAKNILAVPINAVTTREDEEAVDGTYDETIKEYVFTDSAGYAVLREVSTGLQDNHWVQINSGLKDGTNVITAPYAAIARTLKNGEEIEIVERSKLYEDED